MSKTVLVIDDDKLARRSLRSALEEAGLEVVEAVNGREGLDKALKLHPDLVVADLMMPEMDGMAMIEQLRQDEWGKSAPIIVLSANEDTPVINQALAAGVTVYLSKMNSSPQELAAQVAEFLSGAGWATT